MPPGDHSTSEPPEDTMTIAKDKLAEFLLKLDSQNDQHWTDDGLPRVNVVQELANDTSITRAQINDAAPGYARKVQGDEPAPEVAVQEAGQGPEEHDGFDASMEPEVNGPGTPLSEDEVKAILKRRVDDAETRVLEARKAISEANDELARCVKRVDRARLDFHRRFPALSPAQSIKQHLAAQQELLRQRVEGTGKTGRDQIDVAMGQSNRRGWTRPSRPVQNVGQNVA